MIKAAARGRKDPRPPRTLPRGSMTYPRSSRDNAAMPADHDPRAIGVVRRCRADVGHRQRAILIIIR
jgi:hypothetical protein